MYFVSWVVYILLLKAGILILLKSGSAQFLYITLGFIVLMEAILNCTVYKVRILNDFSLVILVIIAMSSLIFCYFNELSRPYIKFKKVNNKETFIMLLISGIIVYLPTATLSIIFK